MGAPTTEMGPMLKARILLVGDDDILMETRKLLLSNWEVSTMKIRSALAAPPAEPFDLLILCQTVRTPDVERFLANRSKYASEILVIRGPNDSDNFPALIHSIDLLQRPVELIDQVRGMLGGQAIHS